MSKQSINGSSCSTEFPAVPGELSTTSTGALCLPVSRIYYTTVSPFLDLPPLNTGNGPENRYRDLARPPSCRVPKRFRLQDGSMRMQSNNRAFCFVQMNLSTSTLVLLNRSGSLSGHGAWNIDRNLDRLLVIIVFSIWRCSVSFIFWRFKVYFQDNVIRIS